MLCACLAHVPEPIMSLRAQVNTWEEGLWGNGKQVELGVPMNLSLAPDTSVALSALSSGASIFPLGRMEMAMSASQLRPGFTNTH